MGKASGQDPRINTNVEILKNIEDKEKDDEENKSSYPNREATKDRLS